MPQPPRVDPFDPAFKANPYPTYAELRSTAPIHRITLPEGRGVWLVTRYEDVLAIFKDERFVKDWRKVLTPEQLAQIPQIPPVMEPLSKNMLETDPPDHERLRALSEDRNKFRAWTDAAVSGNGTAEYLETVLVPRMQAFSDYLLEMFEEKRENPRDDLISALVRAEEAGERLSEHELLGMVFLLLVAGHETTVNLIGNGTLALLQHPDQLEKLRNDPSLIKSAIEELLRYDGPLETSPERFAREDVAIGGTVIPRGEMVRVVIAAADRDAERFPDPDALDITRTDNKHLAFGKGIHHCLGAPLARMEGQIAIDTLLRRMPGLRLREPPESISWRPGMVMRGLQGLPVEF
jgi:cytochrome P450